MDLPGSLYGSAIETTFLLLKSTTANPEFLNREINPQEVANLKKPFVN
jgi:hypothetical protein